MPFITQMARQELAEGRTAVTAGEQCYLEYKLLMEQWKADPRWTTIDGMMFDFLPDANERARFLAFMVFFNLHGMSYEDQKRQENGDVE
jgi:hypothetical protein